MQFDRNKLFNFLMHKTRSSLQNNYNSQIIHKKKRNVNWSDDQG
jgi:hypothetical protein